MLCINAVPPKSVDRTYFYETFTISTSKGLVNLERFRAKWMPVRVKKTRQNKS